MLAEYTNKMQPVVLTGFIVSLLAFIAYCYMQLTDSAELEFQERKSELQTDFRKW